MQSRSSDGLPEPHLLAVTVECYAGHRGEETPRVLVLGDRRIDVVDVLDAWLAPDHRYFKLRGDDRHTYLVRLGAIQLFTEWRGKAFYLNARYRTRSRKPEDDFVVRTTRMTLTGFGRFDLAYFRHTNKWFTVYRNLTAAECFREIEENEIFWPMT